MSRVIIIFETVLSGQRFPPSCLNSVSIVDSLKSIGAPSDYNYRARIAAVNGITNYRGTAEQNTRMLNLLKAGQLIKP